MAHRPSWIGVRLILLLASAATSSHSDTLLKMTSDPGDPVGQGRTYFYTPSNGTFYLSAPPPYVNAAVVSGSDVWRLTFGAPYGRPLGPAIYADAVRNAGPVDAIIDIALNSHNCNTNPGSFQVRQAERNAQGTLISFWGTFEQHCESGVPALRGEIRINADTSLYVGAPSDVSVHVGTPVHFDVRAEDADGLQIALAANGVPAGATFTDHGDGSGSFDWPAGPSELGETNLAIMASDAGSRLAFANTVIHCHPPRALDMQSAPGDYVGGGLTYHLTDANAAFLASRNFSQGVSFDVAGSGHSFHLDFAAPGSQPLAPGTYLGAIRFPFQGTELPGLSVYGDGRGCNALTGTFTVKDVGYSASGEVESFLATFEQHCEGQAPALTGQIVFELDRPVPTLASLIESDVAWDQVRLRWFADNRRGQSATVYRRTAVSEWVSIALAAGDGAGYFEILDATIQPGVRYAYRLGWGAGAAATYGPETWIDVPGHVALELSLAPIQPNPVHGSRFSVAFVKPIDGPASIDLLDVSGRVAFHRDLAALGAGRHTVPIGVAGALPPGFYLARLRAGDHAVTRHVLLIR